MKFDLPLTALLVIGAVAGAATQSAAAPKYSIEDVRACSGDAMRLCKKSLPSIKNIESCMRAHYAELNPRCQARFNQ